MKNEKGKEFLFRENLIRALLISIAFFIVEFILVQFHEVWTDEVHSWAIAMSSHSPGELIYNARYEGHPKLWYILLFVLQIFTHNIYYMQVLHVFIAACVVFVFCYFSPFKVWQNILICSGYFFAYEYSIISRNYGIGLLLLFLCAGIYTRSGGRKLLLLSFLFFLLFQTNVYEVIIGVPFYIYILYSIYKSNTAQRNKLYVSGLIALVGFLLSAYSMRPPTRTIFTELHTRVTFYDLSHTLATIFCSWFPMPEISPNFWSSNILNGLPGYIYLQAFLSVLLLIAAIFTLKRNRGVLILFCAGIAGIMVFTYVLNYGDLRHHGHSYILFLVCYWIYISRVDNQHVLNRNKFSALLEKYFIPAIFVVQSCASLSANALDIKYTFSNDMAVARYLKDNSLDTLPILGIDDYTASGVAGIMNKDMYFIIFRYWGRWILLDSSFNYHVDFTQVDLIKTTTRMVDKRKSDVIELICNPNYVVKMKNWELLKSFQGSVIGEDFYIYRVKYVPVTAEESNMDGKIMINLGKTDDAITFFNNAILAKPGYIEAYMNLAACYDTGKHNFVKALEMIDSALKYAPDDYNILFDKGTVLADKQDTAQALIFFTRTIQANSKFPEAYIYAALCNMTYHNYDKAIAYLNKLLIIDPKNEAAHNMLNMCYKNKRIPK